MDAEMPATYRKKPVVINAIRWTGHNHDEILAFMGKPAEGLGYQHYLTIHTLEGDHRADIGDWIIKGIKDEFYPCKPDIFEMTYELAERTLAAPPSPILEHAQMDLLNSDERQIEMQVVDVDLAIDTCKKEQQVVRGTLRKAMNQTLLVLYQHRGVLVNRLFQLRTAAREIQRLSESIEGPNVQR